MRAIDLVEIHEAFAAQVLANAAAWQQGWKGPATDRVIWDRVNVNGSSISVGHPWSATGGRILTTLANEMARRNARYGLISMCAAGAMAGAHMRSEEHTSELQSLTNLVCRLLLEKKKKKNKEIDLYLKLRAK